MFELLCEQAAVAPERAVAITVDRSISYAALAARSRDRWRDACAGPGSGAATASACFANNRIEWLEVFFAAAAIGADRSPVQHVVDGDGSSISCCSDSGVRLLFAIPALANATSPRTLLPCAPAAPVRARRGLSSSARRGHVRGFEAYSRYGEGESLPSLAAGRRRKRR